MCDKDERCEKGKTPGCCSVEQVEKCHGKSKHPCR